MIGEDPRKRWREVVERDMKDCGLVSMMHLIVEGGDCCHWENGQPLLEQER